MDDYWHEVSFSCDPIEEPEEGVIHVDLDPRGAVLEWVETEP